MDVVHALALGVGVASKLLLLLGLAQQHQPEDEEADEDADGDARSDEHVERRRADGRDVAADDGGEVEADAAVAAVVRARRDVAAHLAEAVSEEGRAVDGAESVVVVRIVRGLERAVCRGRRHVAQLEPDVGVGGVAPRLGLLAIRVAAVVVSAEAGVGHVEVGARVLVRRLVRPVLTLEAARRCVARAAVVGAVGLLVALVSVGVAVGSVEAARLVVARFVALAVVDERGQARVGAAGSRRDAVILVPRAGQIVAGLVAEAVAEPRERAAGRTEVLQLVLAVVAAVTLVPHALGRVARNVAHCVAQPHLVAAGRACRRLRH
mmetsp:Transcript_37509/g.82511  ORF Transcript_37509/g.82511 Transcript_37509/m.82511 type:complete len:322 (+) Transcript_37509:105-1070(+)